MSSSFIQAHLVREGHDGFGRRKKNRLFDRDRADNNGLDVFPRRIRRATRTGRPALQVPAVSTGGPSRSDQPRSADPETTRTRTRTSICRTASVNSQTDRPAGQTSGWPRRRRTSGATSGLVGRMTAWAGVR